MRLAATHLGEGPRIVLVHGFTQTSASWGRIATDLARDHEVVMVDAPGHGDSATIRVGLWRTGDLLASFGPAIFLGYSMGARMCLHLTLAHPELVDGLIMLGGTAGIELTTELAARQASDERWAVMIETDGVEAFLDQWLAQPMFARLSSERLGRSTDAAGLASSLRLAGTGTQDPLWDRLGEIHTRTLVLAGQHDEKFSGIGQRLAASIGTNATFATIPDAHHAAHLEQPAEFVREIRRFLR